jgi:hypothetical protein
MTISTIRSTAVKYEALAEYNDFAKAALAVMATDMLGDAAEKAEAAGFSPRVCNALHKAAQGATMLGGSGISGALGPFLPAFMAQVANTGAFDAVAAAALQMPLRTSKVVIASSAAAGSVSEGAAKPIRGLTLTASDFNPVKVVSEVVLSEELVMSLGSEGVNALANELRRAVAVGADAALLAALTVNSAEAAGLDSIDGFSDDLGELMRSVDANAGSKLFLILPPDLGRQLAAKALVGGLNLSWSGGSIAGVEVRVSDAQDAGRMTLVAADGLAVASTPLELRSSNQASVQMDTAPTMNSTSPTAVQTVSMFQTNCRCLRAERQIGIKAIRANSYAHLTGVALGQGAGSPV